MLNENVPIVAVFVEKLIADVGIVTINSKRENEDE